MSRLDVQEAFETLLGHDRVYYQPPESYRMQYPCLVYNIQRVRPVYADDGPYFDHEEYLATYITRNPDDQVVDLMRSTRGFVFDRHFTSDNMHHFVFRYVIY